MSGKTENLLKQASETNAVDSSTTNSTKVFQTETEAEACFLKLREKLFHIELWNDKSEISSFALYNADGVAEPQKTAAVGDFIKTTLPGTGKDDWVKIIEISDAPDEIVLTIQPSGDPTNKTGDATVSHFFVGDSTNNFCLQKVGAKVNFHVIGLNERSNTTDTGGIVETVRNFATANIGYFFGIQKTQWQTFCDNFIESGEFFES